MSAWLLPDHIADVLPSEARHIEELRRQLLDTARGYGCELVMPPLLEHLESLLSGTGEALDLQTFKLVDQLSGRSWACAPTPRRRSRASTPTCSTARAWRACATAARCCTPGPTGRMPPASRCSSAPRSTATPASKPTSRCCCWRSTACAAGVRPRHRRPGRRAHRARAVRRRAGRRRRRCARACGAGRQGRQRAGARSPGVPAASRDGLPRWSSCTAMPRCSTRPPASCPHGAGHARRAGRPEAAGWAA
jgi:hypothetical protein